MLKDNIDKIWQQYVERKDLQTKQWLIEHYIYLVKLVAGRLGIYLNQYVDLDDLVSYGILGLIDAIDKFDPYKNVKFETYASLRIRGAILDAIRKLDWVPRTLRKKQKEVDRAYVELETQLGRQPEDEEVAKYLGIKLEEYNELLKEVNITTLISVDEYSYQLEAIKDTTAESPAHYVQEQETKEMLTKSIEDLPDREKQVIFLYYFEELTLKEISNVLEVSESRVSQLHTKAVSRLRSKMEKYDRVLPL
ncbi:FliA/WhiG family RNA polymerase sigma factor [Sporanaerobium hydrogeniformans]|uniref:FliA/WhiG family RNA polymerase sigma factor n=1 Tax=Sporanaerobium hydrogeniformans TaxID=3072179 RepID=A0AC61DGP3_9FIRM|nr:FliA/WhiG family RNA polymerase sigma factor [Sporanaerobium hydrogeniformans]PHV71767.1 FliA/WhiG family RNA polymerase sigma factor [Sporanaerobium hydrogeniformans]